MTKNILALDGKALQREIDRIAKENQPRSKAWTVKETQIATRLYEKGVPTWAIAKELGRTQPSVRNFVQSHNIRHS
jgi:DNA-binding NarL/FixJ family response regulator